MPSCTPALALMTATGPEPNEESVIPFQAGQLVSGLFLVLLTETNVWWPSGSAYCQEGGTPQGSEGPRVNFHFREKAFPGLNPQRLLPAVNPWPPPNILPFLDAPQPSPTSAGG